MGRARIALGLEYDGRAWAGWQTQPHGNTVQDQLERALLAIAGTHLSAVAAGRTDAGVHALQQVVHFDCEVSRPATAWVRGVNSHLPDSIAVLWAREVDASFHARFSAHSRSYRYFLLAHPVRPAMLAGKVGWTHLPLNVEQMQQAAALAIGRHDFSSFRAAECQANSPVRTLSRFSVQAQQGLICFDLTADAFLHHMVRNLVGALVYVGKGSLSAADFACLLAAGDRRAAPPTFMPDGLYLTGVGYPAGFGIAAAADAARLTLWR